MTSYNRCSDYTSLFLKEVELLTQLASRFTHRLTIITGHYGTGKTEFSVNLALALSNAGEETMLADLDIVNPYFRSRERRATLEAAGVKLIATSQSCTDADVPSLPPALLTILQHPTARGVLDIGGDPAGSRVLARFAPQIRMQDTQLVFVCNANRPEVSTVEKALSYLRAIEKTTGLTCTGLVNNTHLCGETTPETIRQGAALTNELSQQTNIPVLCHAVVDTLCHALPELDPAPIQLQMRKPWE